MPFTAFQPQLPYCDSLYFVFGRGRVIRAGPTQQGLLMVTDRIPKLAQKPKLDVTPVCHTWLFPACALLLHPDPNFEVSH